MEDFFVILGIIVSSIAQLKHIKVFCAPSFIRRMTSTPHTTFIRPEPEPETICNHSFRMVRVCSEMSKAMFSIGDVGFLTQGLFRHTQVYEALNGKWHEMDLPITWTPASEWKEINWSVKVPLMHESNLLQIAHVSHSTSQLHIATAFHFFNVNILSGLEDSLSNLSHELSFSSAILRLFWFRWPMRKRQISGI